MIHTQLPIYKTGQQLTQLAYQAQAQMPRGYKRTLGEQIAHECMQMLTRMAQANATKGQARLDHIAQLLVHKDTAQVLLRVGHDLRIIPTKVWSHSVQLLGSIGRQGGGWLAKSQPRKAPAA